MYSPSTDSSPSTRGRILAMLYLVVVACGIAGQAAIADAFVSGTDSAAAAARIRANPSLYRLGYTIFMIEMVAQIVTSVMFYDLLKPVDRSLARIAMVLAHCVS